MRQIQNRQCGDTEVSAGRGSGQEPWYAFIGPQFKGDTVLDVGCGLGAGIDILAASGCFPIGQDLDERLRRDDVLITPLESLPSAAYDCITCIDVVEHVENDAQFVAELVRCARKAVFLTTPLSTYNRPLWPYHVREYTFPNFRTLMERFGRCDFFKGTSSGDKVYPISNLEWFTQFSWCLNHPVFNLPARVVNRALPVPWRNLSHQAVLIRL